MHMVMFVITFHSSVWLTDVNEASIRPVKSFAMYSSNQWVTSYLITSVFIFSDMEMFWISVVLTQRKMHL